MDTVDSRRSLPATLGISLFGFTVYAVAKMFMAARKRKLLRTKLKGKVVCITGASSGIGSELAKLSFAYGSKVILVARRRNVLEDVKREMINRCPPNLRLERENDVKIVEADLGVLDDIPERAHEMVNCFGHIDVLINNAGIGSRGSVLDTEVDVHSTVMTVNYLSQVVLIKSLLPHLLRRQEETYIVGVSSLQGKFSLPYRSAYGASKHAVQAFYDTLRAEIEPNSKVSVCLVSPGYVKTNISKNALSASGELHGKVDKTTENGMEPSECARQILEAMVHNRKDVCLAPFYHSMLVYVRTFLPSLQFAIMRWKSRKDAKLYAPKSS